MKCEQARAQFSSYLDTALPGREMQAIGGHLEECAGCRAEYRSLEQNHELLMALGPRKAPPELALRIRLAISREASERSRRSVVAFLFRLQDEARGLMIPATAGLLSAVVFFGILIGFWARPAIGDDVPIPSFTYIPPQLSAMPADSVDSDEPDPILVETFVDENGRVQDYRVLNTGVDMKAIGPQLDSILIFTRFQPAMAFGRRTSGRVVLSFSNVHVKG